MKKLITNSKDWTATTEWIPKGLVNDCLLDNILKGIVEGAVQVQFRHIDPQKQEWDGEMVIDFLQPLSTQAIVNGFIQFARADETWMDGDSLRLWWD